MRLWHYTTSAALRGIFNDGEIKCDRILIKGEIPCVCLSTNPNWEETVRKVHENKKTGVKSEPLSRDGILKSGFSPIRIEIDPSKVNIIDWKTHCKKIPQNIAQGLEDTAKEWGADPKEWWFSYKPISIDCFISPIESWNGKKWVAAIKKN